MNDVPEQPTTLTSGDGAASGDLAPGSVIREYRVLKLLGCGGMGQVYLVEHVHMRKKYALKLLPHDLSLNAQFVQRFRIEARIMADLDHPHIVRVHQMGEEQGMHFLVMDYIEGGGGKPWTLEDELREAGVRRRLPEPAVREIALQICSALAYAHERGVVHRDLKPSNILLQAVPRGGHAGQAAYHVRISDFGLAKVLGDEYLHSMIERSVNLTSTEASEGVTTGARYGRTSTGAVLGTYDYMSPEQKAGEQVSPQSDTYSLGIILYRMLTGERPEGRFKSPTAHGCRKPWDKIIDRCLEPQAGSRYRSIMDLRHAIVHSSSRSMLAVVAVAAAAVAVLGMVMVTSTVGIVALFRHRAPAVVSLPHPAPRQMPGPVGYTPPKRVAPWQGTPSAVVPADKGDGQWTEVMSAAPWSARKYHTVVSFNNALWLMGGWDASSPQCADVWSSADGTAWSRAVATAPWAARSAHAAVVYDNKMWIMGGWSESTSSMNDVWQSADGTNWVCATAAASWDRRNHHQAIVHADKMWVLGGIRDGNPSRVSDVWWSTNGANWTCATTAAPWSGRYYHSSVSYNGRMWVMGGYDGAPRNDVWSSADGQVWRRETASAPWSARMRQRVVVLEGKMWLIGGGKYDYLNLADMWTSTDGTNWLLVADAAAWPPRYGHDCVVHNDALMLLGGGMNGHVVSYNDVWQYQKPDSSGAAWTQVTPSAAFRGRVLHRSLSFDNALWVIGGRTPTYMHDVWRSSNGAEWSLVTRVAPWRERCAYAALTFDGKMWVVGAYFGDNENEGSTNDVWSSNDGTNWACVTAAAPWSARNSLAATVHNGKMWMLGGTRPNMNDVWNTSDGTNRTCVTAAAAWTPRHGLAVASFKGRMWVLGGWDTANRNDVWSSEDGVRWECATPAAPWPARSRFDAVVYDGQLIVMAGVKDHGDMWASSDGTNWSCLAAAAEWPARSFHSCTVHDGAVWLLGGSANDMHLNDVWRYEQTQATCETPMTRRTQ